MGIHSNLHKRQNHLESRNRKHDGTRTQRAEGTDDRVGMAVGVCSKRNRRILSHSKSSKVGSVGEATEFLLHGL